MGLFCMKSPLSNFNLGIHRAKIHSNAYYSKSDFCNSKKIAYNLKAEKKSKKFSTSYRPLSAISPF